MGTGQILLTVSALMVLGIIILSANSTLLENERVVMDSEFGVAAISLATSLVEEVQGKIFDAAGADSGITALSKLTAPGSLGPSSTERYRPTDSTKSDFNDVDDFNNFYIEFVADPSKPKRATYRGDSRGFRADYYLRARVCYVNPIDLDGISPVATWHKKLVVSVSSPSSRDTLIFPTVISYWN